MGRIMAIDYGSKRVGLAVTDPDKIIATGLSTVPTEQIFSFINQYIVNEPVERFVIGEAANLDGSETDSTSLIEDFVGKLKIAYPDIPISRVDESFTSKMASETMISSGLKKKDRRNKALIDEISATIILQSYMVSPEA
ncbi:MAG: Holliday junction resolvase RuvX [Bacteroidetes bacterium]|nr:Holliday junction resolvase RuvX [Bacteroidota bacterium]